VGGGGSKLHRLELLGVVLCQGAYKRLLGLGTNRFQRLRSSVTNNDDDCPLDLRYVPKKMNNLNWKKRQIVHDFLHDIYETLAEPMPSGTGCSKRPRTIKKRDDKLMEKRTGLIEKALPPGSFHEYLEMLRRQNRDMTFSYKLFCSV